MRDLEHTAAAPTNAMPMLQDDWGGDFATLASANGHAVLAVDLPGHGSSGSFAVHAGRRVVGAASPSSFPPADSPAGGGDDERDRAFGSIGEGVIPLANGGGGAPGPDSTTSPQLRPQSREGSSGNSTSSGQEVGGGGDDGDDGVPLWGLGGVGLAAEAVCAVCDAVGAGPYLVVGYSMGGRVALAMAARRPSLMEGGGGLVLVSSSPGLTR